MEPRILLVAAATGTQSGATIKALVASSTPGVSIRALVRSKASEKAQALVGVELVEGSFDDSQSLKNALVGVDSAFLVTTPFGEGQSPEAEIRQGKAFIDAAKGAGVKHLVFTSVEGAERKTGIPHADGKHEIEQHLFASGMRYTVVRPVIFMDLFPLSVGAELAINLWTLEVFLRGRKLQMVASEDIGWSFLSASFGWFCAQALLNPADYGGRQIPLAGDALTMAEVRATYAKVTGQTPWNLYLLPGFLVKWLPIPPLFLKTLTVSIFYMWYGSTAGYEADVEARRAEHPAMMTFETWLSRKIKAA
ncbi:hypothetical protein BCR39DRAFT_507949 [Naematelia encephala]|uniref:NmrA-like domain-containing protein n=1 Tax=Naematelia encephala TaxID=71784 RepID=A0A1Y2ALH4_9TREE|nr:hypothetical protein BCR39DRAFT_507949 [Naematelia encephala]